MIENLLCDVQTYLLPAFYRILERCDLPVEQPWFWWLFVSFVCLVMEMLDGSLYLFCISVGAAAGAVVSHFGFGVEWQIVVSVCVTLAMVIWCRPIAKRIFWRKERLSNADALIGRRVKVTRAITMTDFGRVAVDGDQWKAVCEACDEVPVGALVTIVDRMSTVLVVQPVMSVVKNEDTLQQTTV